MGAEIRKEFLKAVHVCEGWTDPTGAKLYSQNKGAFAEAIKLAIYLCGNYVTEVEITPDYPTLHTGLCIRACKPEITGQRLKKTRLDNADVWCIQTDLGTWVMRQNGKIILTGNSIIYGCQEKKADATYHVAGAYAKVRHRFPKIAQLSDRQIMIANKTGGVETIPDRRVNPRRGYPIMCARSDYGKVKPTLPLNYHVSGTAMQWMNMAMVDCHAQLVEWRETEGFDGYIVMQVHDEMVFDLPKRAHPLTDPENSNLPRIRVLQRLMEQGGDAIGVPTPVGIEYNERTWDKGVGI